MRQKLAEGENLQIGPRIAESSKIFKNVKILFLV